MNKNTTFHSYKTRDLVDKFNGGHIIIDNTYQRRSLWLTRDKVRLIETILNDFLIPPIYLWDAEMNADTGENLQHIVDGQQRITAIVDFIEEKFKLEEKHLMLEGEEKPYFNLSFSQLSPDEKKKIWSYEVPAIDLRDDVTAEQIRVIFTRLNLTEYSLNNQERRHSGKQGLFANTAYKLAEINFWEDSKLFTTSDLRRMKDIEFCASLLLLARRGIVDQTTQKPINEAYDDYSETYEELDDDYERIIGWIEILSQFAEGQTLKFMRKKTQLHSMFCLADHIHRNSITITPFHTERLEDYIEHYNLFKNDSDNNEVDETYLPIINRHKLASSEGIHKQKNRMVRFSALKEVIFETP